MTNVVGRYPIHFHHTTTGAVGEVTDCAIHRSFYRAVTVHDTFNLRVSRNVAYDITGHAFYLESGVEEQNTIEYNLASFIHAIDGPLLMGSTLADVLQTSRIAVPADHTASGFYISNAYNYIVGNAASGGWSGLQFPVLPDPVDKTLRYNGIVPKDRPALVINGNSMHSTSYFGTQAGGLYDGGVLFWEEADTNSTVLKYNAGRKGTLRMTRNTKDANGVEMWFRVTNTTAWLVNVGATGWARRTEFSGFEIHDHVRRSIFVLFEVWFDKIIINCRTSNAPRVPDAGSRHNENMLNAGKVWAGFFSYDHLMKHILTDWRISNCGGVARKLQPWVSAANGGVADTGTAGMFTIPVNGFGPEIQIASKGTTYDWSSLGGTGFVNQSIFFAASGSDNFHSMQYMSSWLDADGSMTARSAPTVIAPLRAGSWWHLDFRPGRCEQRSGWKLPSWTCDKGSRLLGSMFTVVYPQRSTQGSDVIRTIIPGASQTVIRSTRMGSMTHFGLAGNGSIHACDPPAPCAHTAARSWDPDLTGAFNHREYGGWYLSFDRGMPKHLSIQRVQMPEGAVMLQAISVPPGTTASDLNLYADSYQRTYSYTPASSVAAVRAAPNGNLYFLDTATDTLFYRVITGYVDTDATFDWINRSSTAWTHSGLKSFSRAGLTVHATMSKNQFNLRTSAGLDPPTPCLCYPPYLACCLTQRSVDRNCTPQTS